MWILLLLIIGAAALLYIGKPLFAWVLPGLLGLVIWYAAGDPGAGFWIAALVFGALVALLGVPGIRRAVVSGHLMKAIAPMMPAMSETETSALEAGTVWWDRDLFSGSPNWKRFLDFPVSNMSQREREFLDGPTDELCRMVDDWDVVQTGDLDDEVWSFLKEKGFLGMIIPEEYGGLGFSAAANSAVITKVSSRSITAAVTVMVPNSLGPAELLLHYGTDEQKKHYLPRLARGIEVPCFALTEPNAGSDAASLTSSGVVCRGEYEGREVVGIRLNWDKRYITLAPVATVIGLAFQLSDPEHLIGDKDHLGITCALVPAHLPGITTGQRHDPMGVPFYNGPTSGKDVFVPLDSIIGGKAMAGKGWMMLMQSLAAGRGISIPGLSAAAAQLSARTVGTYANVRKQFNLKIGRFEGVEEAIARIAGMTYILDAGRTLTTGAIDAGEKPSVITAILKCYSTEGMRDVVNDAMDVLGGAGICRGPRNIMATAYMGIPIGITVEGANILTRSMIIFGQGAIRCHPYAYEEMQAIATRDVPRFDRAFFGHIGFIATNAARTFVLGLTRGALARSVGGTHTRAAIGDLTRLSSALAFISDIAMGTLGGKLKFKEKLTGRLADALSWLYLGSAAVKRFHDDGEPESMRAYVTWSTQTANYRVQEALRGFLDNFPIRPLAWLMRVLVFPTGTHHKLPSDRTAGRVARALLEDSEVRSKLTSAIYQPASTEPGLGALEAAFAKIQAADTVESTVRDAVRQKRLERKPKATLMDRALEAGVIDESERKLVEEAEAARADAVAVDAFGEIREFDQSQDISSAS